MFKENIMVSVIVPVYNVESFLEKCIDSVLAQTMPDFELILVDDGSVDSSGKICDDYLLKDSRISVIHKQNGGAGLARNTGLDVAKGKYIYFLDSDDYIDPVLLEKTVSVMEEKQCDWLGFGMVKENPEGQLIEKIAFKPREITVNSEEERMEFLLKYLLNYRIGWEACNHIFRNDIITQHNLRFIGERKDFGEDMLFSFTYWLYAKKCMILPEIYYHYIQHTDSLMWQSKFRNVLPQIHKLSVDAYKAVLDSGLQLLKNNFEIIYMHLIEWQTRPYIKEKGLQWVKEELFKLDYTYFLPADYNDLQKLYRERIKAYGQFDGVVSVVIPVMAGYDNTQIEKHIEIITSQSLQKLDIILLHNGEEDLKYTDIRVRDVVVEDFTSDNIIRTVFDECYGEYIWFADVDSDIEQDYFEHMSDVIKYNDCGTAILTKEDEGFIDNKSLQGRLEFRKNLKHEEYQYSKFLFKSDLLRKSGLYDFNGLKNYFSEIVLSDHILFLKEK